MKARRAPSTSSKRLRARAEESLCNTPRDVGRMPAEDAQTLVHELQVHQIELEMQNDELRRTQQDLEAARDRYADLYNFAPSALLTLNAQGEILEANFNAGDMFGLERSELVHQKLSRFVPAEAQDTFYLFCRQVFRSCKRRTTELDLVNAQANRLVVHVEASGDATPNRPMQRRFSFTDITGRKRTEERIAQLNRAQAILAGVDRGIVHVPNRQELLDEICRVAVEKGGFKLAWIGMVSPDGLVQPLAKAGATAYLDGIRVGIHDDEPEGRGPVGTAIRENRIVVIEDIVLDARMAPWHDRAQRFGLHYVAAFPIRIAGKVAGSFQAYAPRAGFFDDTELSLLKQVSDEISFALTAIGDSAMRKLAEDALQQNERELADFFHSSPLGLLWVRPDGHILRVNEAELELLGCATGEVLGRPITRFSADPEVAADLLDRLAKGETVENCHVRIRRKDRSIKHVLIDANGLWEKDQLIHSRWFVRDISRRVELEREILRIIEVEQRRLGHDLHDDLCQQLAGIAFRSDSLARRLVSPAESGQAKQIAELARTAMTQAREMAAGLSPVPLEAEGLMEALKALAERTKKVFHIDCKFQHEHPVLVPDSTVALHLYRIAQEAVGNAIKHGKARRVDIGLTANGNDVVLAVRDNGLGIPVKARNHKGMGLRIMQYRAGVIGGSLLVQRDPNGGTTVVCTVSNGLLPPKERMPE
jgi:PAS domain S-box-containing protein